MKKLKKELIMIAVALLFPVVIISAESYKEYKTNKLCGEAPECYLLDENGENINIFELIWINTN